MVVLIHFSWQSMPLRRMRSAWWPFSTSMVSPSRKETTRPVAGRRIVSFLYRANQVRTNSITCC